MGRQQTFIPQVASSESFLSGPRSHSDSRTNQRVATFFVWLFLIPGILYLTAIPLVRLPSYEHWGPSHWGPMLDYAWNAQGVNADVVIFGDSSAFLGIDPHLVDNQLGIKSVVLPNTVGSLPVNQDQALESYLAHNSRPRLLVLYFTAWDLNYGATTDTRLYEGEEMLLRHDSLADIARFAVKHPLELPAFPLRNYSTVGPTIVKSILHGDNRAVSTAAALGHVDDREDYPPLGADCSLPARYLKADRVDSVRALASKYKLRGYNVVVYLAPMPACSNAVQLTHGTFDGLALAPPAALPPASFKGDGFYAHINPGSVAQSTQTFISVLRHVIQPHQVEASAGRPLDHPSGS